MRLWILTQKGEWALWLPRDRRATRLDTWTVGVQLPVSGVEGPSREIAATRRLKRKTRPTHGSFSATNKVQFVEVPSPERLARNLTSTVGFSLSRARAIKLPKQATDRPCVKVSGAPIARQPESPFPFLCGSSAMTMHQHIGCSWHRSFWREWKFNDWNTLHIVQF